MALGQGVLAGKKTYIAAGMTGLGIIVAYLTGDVGLYEVLKTLGELATIAFLRGGIKSDVAKATEELPWLGEKK